MTTDQKYALIDRAHELKITLDGKPATLAGAKQPFAGVAALDGSTGWVQFSWDAVARILNSGGQFKS